MKKIILYITAFGMASLIGFTNCGGEALFTNMNESTLNVVIKGTYESNTPVGAWTFPGATSVMDDTVYMKTDAGDAAPSTFMLDIAEMRLIDDRGDDHKFSDVRQGFAAPMASSPFFNGTGLVLQNDDPPAGNYVYVLLYVRKMIFDGATQYLPTTGGWTAETATQTIFFEETVNGYNFNGTQTGTQKDTLTYDYLYGIVNRVFPIIIPISGGMTVRRNESRVLEIRLALNNFMKLYETETYTVNGYRLVHYYAPSDWLRDKKPGDSVMGGNIHAIARSYAVGQTGSISITGGAGQMVIAVQTATAAPFEKKATLTPRAQYGGFNCDMPTLPAIGGSTADYYMDYYLAVENYIEDWNINMAAGTACPNLTQYEANWIAYDSEAWAFSVPPLAIRATGGTVTITNVPPGTYNLFQANYPTYGQLFDLGTFTPLTTATVTVVAGATSPASF